MLEEKTKYFLYAENIKKQYHISGKKYKISAVNDVSLGIRQNEVFGLVGESGCGKSTLTKLLIGLEKTTDGTIYYKGQDIQTLSKSDYIQMRREMQMVFQDPYDSLNPRMTIEEIIREPLYIHKVGNRNQQNIQIKKLIEMVGISSQQLTKYPHQLSGGQRQRICIARALALSPKVIVCDEAVSALDVSVQAQILNLLKDIKEELKLTIIFVSHDLAVVSYISDRIAVMYRGRIVEQGSRNALIKQCLHPYSKALFSAIPDYHNDKTRERIILKGEVNETADSTKLCSFYCRCPLVDEKCNNGVPCLRRVTEEQFVACHKI